MKTIREESFKSGIYDSLCREYLKERQHSPHSRIVCQSFFFVKKKTMANTTYYTEFLRVIFFLWFHSIVCICWVLFICAILGQLARFHCWWRSAKDLQRFGEDYWASSKSNASNFHHFRWNKHIQQLFCNGTFAWFDQIEFYNFHSVQF